MYGTITIVLIALMAPLKPFDDDIYYISPIPSFDSAGLLPTEDHWRPFDYLFRVILGFFPEGYPLLNHAVVVIGFVATLYLLRYIAIRHIGLSQLQSILPSIFFLTIPAIFVALASIDSLNQVWSAFFGIVAVAILLRSFGLPSCLMALLCCVCATFWKESGLVFFLVSPLMAALLLYVKNGALIHCDKRPFRTRLLILLGIGVLLCFVYLGLRFSLQGAIALGSDTGRYSLSLSPVTILRNLAVMLAANFSAVDSIALMLQPRNILLVVVTALGSLPFIVWICLEFVRWIKHSSSRVTLFLVVCLGLVGISPYLVMGSAGEMHAYQLTPFVFVLVSLFIKRTTITPSALTIVFACLLIVSLVSNTHKWVCMKEMGDSTQPVIETIAASYDDGEHPTHVMAFAMEISDEPEYSVFKQTVSDTSEAGQIAGALWGWRYPESFKLTEVYEDMSPTELLQLYSNELEGSDSVWIVWPEGETVVLKKGEDY